ncbi:MAG: hypothetical protein M3Y18_00295 [Candidatus Eremiobacteraeota bacterium]|nr:hypothetical protein [Candidatus Eremiobacteraeota bacterium]
MLSKRAHCFLGVPIAVASARMAHSSIATTQDNYGHVFESMGRDVARKLNDFLEAL